MSTRVTVELSDDDSFLDAAWVSTSTGYAAGAAPIVHVGLGDLDTVTVDAIVELVGTDPIRVNVATNTRTAIAGC